MTTTPVESESNSRSSELQSRVIFGVSLGILMIATLLLLSYSSFGVIFASILFGLAFLTLVWEGYVLQSSRFQFSFLAIMASVFVIFFLSVYPTSILLLSLAVILLGVFSALTLKATVDESEEPGSVERFVLATILIGGGAAAAFSLIHHPAGARWLFYSFVVVSLTDIGSYAIGRKIGGMKLAPLLSPGKTVSGALGGVAVGTVSGTLLSGLLGAPWWFGGITSLTISAVSILSDLSESRLKRLAGKKDSGTLLGAHGGIFDRADSHVSALLIVALLVVTGCL